MIIKRQLYVQQKHDGETLKPKHQVVFSKPSLDFYKPNLELYKPKLDLQKPSLGLENMKGRLWFSIVTAILYRTHNQPKYTLLFLFGLIIQCFVVYLSPLLKNIRHIETRQNMSVIDLVNKDNGTAFSFEVLPPLKGTGIDKLYSDIEKLMPYNPKYINITTHRSEYVYTQEANGLFCRKQTRRRPGTVAVAAAIKTKFGVDVVPHVLCSGYTPEETEYTLIDLQFLGITDILVLRGDKAPHQKNFTPENGGHTHAIDLQHQINKYNEGFFFDGKEMEKHPVPFSYGVACYPEKHEESPNAERDLYWLKQKVEAGAQYAVTQMFFDNKKYFDFVDKARAAGINVPIIPGIKPVKKLAQLNVLPRTFKIDLPEELASEVRKCKTDEEVAALGCEWTINQCRELMQHGVPSLHFYSVGAVDSISKIAKEIY